MEELILSKVPNSINIMRLTNIIQLRTITFVDFLPSQLIIPLIKMH